MTVKEDIDYRTKLQRQARANLGLDENHEGIVGGPLAGVTLIVIPLP